MTGEVAPGWWVGARSMGAVIGIALAVRLIAFPFAENKQADAPMRALIAERMNADPVAAGDPRSFCQFGPLPIQVMRPFMALDGDARRSSRWLSLLAGAAAFLPFFSLGRRMLGDGNERGRRLALLGAGLALALSPLHIQVSTTAASEAIYLFLLLAGFDRLHAALSAGRRADYLGAGLWMSLAAVTRYDTWLALPVACVAALLFGRRDRQAVVNLVLFVVVSSLLPIAYLTWSWSRSGDPFFFARYITQDHVEMARAVNERLGLGVARARQVGIWLVSFAAAMTPVAFLLGVGAIRRWRQWSGGTRVVLAAALAPPAAYLAKGLLFGDFEPLPRFAIAPGTVLLPLAGAALVERAGRRLGSAMDASPPKTSWLGRVPSPLLAITVGALALNATALALAFGRNGRIWSGAESIGPLTRLDAEDRALAEHLIAHRRRYEGVFVDTFGYQDIAIAHAARVPAPLTATLAHTRILPATLAQARVATGASWFAIHDSSWGKDPRADWPATHVRFGQWRLAHLGEAGR